MKILKSNGLLLRHGNKLVSYTPSNITLQDGLVAWWKLDGDATDSSENNNNGGIFGATYDSNGVDNGCYYFDGIDDYITTNLTYEANYSYISISLWMYIENTSSQQFIISDRNTDINTDSFSFLMRINSGEIQVSVKDGSSSQQVTSTDITTNVWTFITFTYEYGKGMKLYFDGNQKDVNNNEPQELDNTQSYDNDIIIGCYRNNSRDYFFKGYLDDIRLWDHALSSTEVNNLYNSY